MDRCGSWNSTVDVEKKKSKVVMPRYAILSKSNIQQFIRCKALILVAIKVSDKEGRKVAMLKCFDYIIVTSTGQQL